LRVDARAPAGGEAPGAREATFALVAERGGPGRRRADVVARAAIAGVRRRIQAIRAAFFEPVVADHLARAPVAEPHPPARRRAHPPAGAAMGRIRVEHRALVAALDRASALAGRGDAGPVALDHRALADEIARPRQAQRGRPRDVGLTDVAARPAV